MNKIKIWYTIEKNKTNNEWVVWMNKEGKNSMGIFGVFSAKRKKDCIEYCKKKGIKYEK